MSKRIVIIGGVAGGMSAAARARRLDERAEITVLEQGGFISFANCGLPYHVAGRIEPEGKLLITTPAKVKERFRIDTRTGVRATAIDRAKREVRAVELATGKELAFAYDKLILAVGAAPIVPQASGVDAPNVLTLRSMEDTRALQHKLAHENILDAVIVGGGFIGLEMAEALTDRGVRVTLVERNPHVLPPLDGEMAVPIEQELKSRDVELVLGQGLKSILTENGRAIAVEVESGRLLGADLVLLSVGVRPNVDLARDAGLTLGTSGGIAVNVHQQTSDPDIYAVGDATEVVQGVTDAKTRVPLGGPANRQGRVAGTHAVLGDDASAGGAQRVMGTAIVQVFGLSAGVTGLSEKAARAAGLSFDTAYVTAAHHASYYPGAEKLRIKLVYETPSGRVLGAQAVGRAGVDKRLDVVSTLLHFGGTVHDLALLDLAYAPQFGSAKDPLHMAAFVAANQLDGTMPAVSSVPEGALLLDVRTPEEFASGSLPGATNAPLETLRDHLGELPKDRPIVTFCQVGQRGYYAQRILTQHGFTHAKNLKGGYALAAQLPL